jgi:tetraacyldisaccharide-1-P 4'-kinase
MTPHIQQRERHYHQPQALAEMPQATREQRALYNFLRVKTLYPDEAYHADDFAFADDGVLLMTEKDAVKCSGLTLPEAWALPVDACIDNAPDGRALLDILLEKLNGRTPA